MGTDGRGPTDGSRSSRTDRQVVYEQLVAALQTLRGGTHAADMAAALLRHARDSTALVALVDGGGRAACYSANARTLAAVPFDRHGVDAAAAEPLARPLDDPAIWVDTAEADWVHPRFRRPGPRD
jgi:hypothetical protein